MTIIIPAYNRPKALHRLLVSAAAAHYDAKVNLLISIDKGGNREVIKIAEQFDWLHGAKEIILQPEHLGLRNHILFCGNLTEKIGPVILLEDDLAVSPFFYHYAQQALNYYHSSPSIAGISLYGYAVKESDFKAFGKMHDGFDVYFMQFPSSWGQVWMPQQWAGFKSWLIENEKTQVKLPAFVNVWSPGSWKKDFLRYMIATGKYFVFPRVSLTTNYGDKGENFAVDMHLFRVQLENQKKDYRFTELSNSKLVFDSSFHLLNSNEEANNSITKIEEAEYQLALREGRISPGKLFYLLFKTKYLVLNYWKVLRKR